MKNVHVFVPVFLYAVTVLIFQIKTIISSEKWCNYVVTFFFFENAKNLGRSDDGKRRKKRRMALKEVEKYSLFNSNKRLFWNGIGIRLVPFSWKYSLELR